MRNQVRVLMIGRSALATSVVLLFACATLIAQTGSYGQCTDSSGNLMGTPAASGPNKKCNLPGGSCVGIDPGCYHLITSQNVCGTHHDLWWNCVISTAPGTCKTLPSAMGDCYPCNATGNAGVVCAWGQLHSGVNSGGGFACNSDLCGNSAYIYAGGAGACVQ